MSNQTLHPEVLWAQRSSATEAARNVVYLSIMAPDVPKSDLKLDIQPTKLTFNGASATKKITYAGELEFYGEIDPAESKVNHTGRDIELVLRKKELKEEYWPRLLKGSAKVHWLKTDFNKWVDEDEQNEKEDDPDMGMGGMEDMGMGGMGGAFGAGGNGFGGIDFSKLGSGPGGPGGMPMDFGGDDEGDDDEDDDDEMPALEDEDEGDKPAEGENKTHPGIEEV